MRRPTSEPPVCATCEVEIRARPTHADGMAFCCRGCAVGGPCTCSYDPDHLADDAIRYCLDVADVVAVDRSWRRQAS